MSDRRMLRLGFTALAVLAVAAGLEFRAPSPADEPAPVGPSATSTPAPADLVSAAGSLAPVLMPERVELPTLGIEAPLVGVGTEPDGAMGTPDSAVEVGWWHGRGVGAGNTLLAGHQEWEGQTGVFARIGELQEGDPVLVHAAGHTFEFRVTWQRIVHGQAPADDILGNTDDPVVTLITCTGPFDDVLGQSRDRIVVRAELV